MNIKPIGAHPYSTYTKVIFPTLTPFAQRTQATSLKSNPLPFSADVLYGCTPGHFKAKFTNSIYLCTLQKCQQYHTMHQKCYSHAYCDQKNMQASSIQLAKLCISDLVMSHTVHMSTCCDFQSMYILQYRLLTR